MTLSITINYPPTDEGSALATTVSTYVSDAISQVHSAAIESKHAVHIRLTVDITNPAEVAPPYDAQPASVIGAN